MIIFAPGGIFNLFIHTVFCYVSEQLQVVRQWFAFGNVL